MTGRFPYGKLVKYPHLSPEDEFVWERFIDDNPTAYKTCDYDVALGDIETLRQTADALGIAGAERVNQYRIDIVGYRDTDIHLIEVKKRATLGTLSEVEEKTSMFNRDKAPDKPTKSVIIAGDITPELDEIAKKRGIILIVI